MSLDFTSFLHSLAEHAPDAVVYTDADGLVRFWNAGATRIFGFTPEDALGQSLDLIIPPNLRARHWTGFAEVMRTGRSRYETGDLLSVPALRKDGTRISVEFSILPHRDEAGRMLGMAAILRDITVRFEELRALRKALAAKDAGTP